MVRRTARELFLTAHHEAAHAVAHARGGVEPNRITIVPDLEAGDAGSFAPIAGLMCPHCHVIGLLVGYAADRKLGRDERRARAGAADDFDRARKLIRRARLGRFAELLSEADRFVNRRRNWRAIQRVALYLLKRKVIAGEELRTLVRLADGSSLEREVARKRAIIATVSRRLTLVGADLEIRA